MVEIGNTRYGFLLPCFIDIRFAKQPLMLVQEVGLVVLFGMAVKQEKVTTVGKNRR